jgi:hypothetical protein
MKRFLAFALLGTACSNTPSQLDMLSCTVVDSTVVDGGICLLPTTNKPSRTQCGEVKEACDTTGITTPNEACLASPNPPGSGPSKVVLTGFVRVFSGGPDTKGTSVTVYDAAPLLGGMSLAATTPLAKLDSVELDPTTQRACDADAAKGCSLPSMTDCACNDGLNGHPDDMKYCRNNGDGNFSCNARVRWEARYTTATAVPTNQQLVIRVTGPSGAPDTVWATEFTWNVYIPANARACVSISDNECMNLSGATPTYQLDVTALSQLDYLTIPVESGLSGGIAKGKAAVAGEVRDCDNIRVEHAVVGISPTPDRFTYFNGNPFALRPEIRVDTEKLGQFAGFNLAPGKVTVAAAAGDTLADLGHFTGFVYADSFSIFNINAGRPIP